MTEPHRHRYVATCSVYGCEHQLALMIPCHDDDDADVLRNRVLDLTAGRSWGCDYFGFLCPTHTRLGIGKCVGA